jgi:hypothetical protein
MFGYDPTIWMPKVNSWLLFVTFKRNICFFSQDQRRYTRLLPFTPYISQHTHLNDPKRLKTQCENMKIPIILPSSETDTLRDALSCSDVILDAIFGFSFKPPVRSPFDSALPLITASKLPVVSVDIPSGWDVENGNDAGVGLEPDVLISLTAPKEGVRKYKGRHFLGGRFVTKLVYTAAPLPVERLINAIGPWLKNSNSTFRNILVLTKLWSCHPLITLLTSCKRYGRIGH